MKFKCKLTNLVYNFEFEADIAAMKQHPDYESVYDIEEPVKETPKKQVPTKGVKNKIVDSEKK